MKIKLNVDRTPHQAKPTSYQASIIRNRLGEGSAEIDTQELTALIENGGSFTPALMDGTSGDNWQSQQVIIADIDNDKELLDENEKKVKDETGHVIKIPVENPLSSETALEACKAAGITPFCMYHSFSNGKVLDGVKLEKYRIVVILDKPITDGEESVELTARFADLFNRVSAECADTTMADKARLIFGSYKGSIINNAGSITPLEVMRALPEVNDALSWEDPMEEPAQNQRIKNNGGWYDDYNFSAKSKIYDDIKAQRRDDIENFNLLDYVMRTERPREHRSGNTTFLNPCPICGHNDDFVINGNLWRCFGAGGDVGGTIIDYIMHRENKTLQEALQKFDTEIMGYEAPKIAAMAETTAEAIKPAENENNGAQEQDLTAALNSCRANNLLADFLDAGTLETPCINSGFNKFDNEMDGGLYPGLYILGAISSMGKTSFLLQLADQISAGKNDVLYFSLEMGAHELIAKSLSRYSYIEAGKDNNSAVYTRTITNAERRDAMTERQRANYEKAIDEYYLNVSGNLWYFESLGDIGINEIKTRVKAHHEITGRRALIFIDYLQIMKPINDTWTEKRNTDKTVLELRKLAKEYNTTVFVISSLNRSSYKGDISMDAFKESGAIEYGSDVLLGLQPRGMASGSYKKDEKKNIELLEDTKAAEVRELELKVLKNRTGRTGQRIPFTYNAKFNYFEEEEEPAPGWTPAESVNIIF